MTHVYIQRVNQLKGAREGWEENRKDHAMARVSMGQKEWPETPSRVNYIFKKSVPSAASGFLQRPFFQLCFSSAAVIRFLISPKIIVPLALIETYLHRTNSGIMHFRCSQNKIQNIPCKLLNHSTGDWKCALWFWSLSNRSERQRRFKT